MAEVPRNEVKSRIVYCFFWGERWAEYVRIPVAMVAEIEYCPRTLSLSESDSVI
jgi:hypothetical protein